jgi:hypothetical protein
MVKGAQQAVKIVAYVRKNCGWSVPAGRQQVGCAVVRWGRVGNATEKQSVQALVDAVVL